MGHVYITFTRYHGTMGVGLKKLSCLTFRLQKARWLCLVGLSKSVGFMLSPATRKCCLNVSSLHSNCTLTLRLRRERPRMPCTAAQKIATGHSSPTLQQAV